MSDFIVQVKIRNARLLKAVRATSDSGADFARKCGVSQTVLSGLLTMKITPLLKDGQWSEHAQKICSFLGVDPAEIWPAHMERVLLKRAESEIELSTADVVAIAGGDDTTMQRDLLQRFSKRLTDREIHVIGRRTAGDPYEDVARDLGVGRERIRQIEFRAYSKMRKQAAVLGIKSYEDTV